MFEGQVATPGTKSNHNAGSHRSGDPVFLVICFDVIIQVVHVLGYGLEDWFEGDLYPV